MNGHTSEEFSVDIWVVLIIHCILWQQVVVTLSLSYMVGTIASFHNTTAVVITMGVTLAISLAIIAFSAQVSHWGWTEPPFKNASHRHHREAMCTFFKLSFEVLLNCFLQKQSISDITMMHVASTKKVSEEAKSVSITAYTAVQISTAHTTIILWTKQ